MAKVTTESIFDAARAVLDEKGFEKSRLADVARKLEITPAALYSILQIKRRFLKQ